MQPAAGRTLAPERASVSAIVLTLDEETLIARCLSYLQWADEILVVDSGSADRTVEIAEAYGARVVVRPLSTWSEQRNFGASVAAHDWVMFVDVDEVVTHDLAESVLRALSTKPNPMDGFSVDRRNEFMGVALENNQRRRLRQRYVRLYNRLHSEYDPSAVVHEYVVVAGRRVLLSGELIHWRRQSLTEMATRAIRYSIVESAALQDVEVKGRFIRIALMPIARATWHLLIKREIRYGTRGLIHAYLRATADFMRWSTLWETQQADSPEHPPNYPPLPPPVHKV